MDSDGLKQRYSQSISEPNADLGAGTAGKAQEPHPVGPVKHSEGVQVLRLIAFSSWFTLCCFVIHGTQIIGLPLYFISKDWYYAYMAYSKQTFGITIITITEWFTRTVTRVSWDPSLRGQFKKTKDGRLETSFPHRMILLSNHQIYTDWLYLWWVTYTGRMHGHLYIVLKESLQYYPMIGPGMMLYGFMFVARKWMDDKRRLQHRISKLKTVHNGPMSGPDGLDPMWFLIFPEGTNLSRNTTKQSAKWAAKQGVPDMRHQLMPRSTGLYFCLQELKGTVDWVYDITMAYEPVPKGGYAPEYFTLRSTYFQGRPPKSVNLHFRRFFLNDIPMASQEVFEKWLVERWREKDDLLEQYYDTGRFPADTGAGKESGAEGGYIETEVKLQTWFEVCQIFIVLAAFSLVVQVLLKLYRLVL